MRIRALRRGNNLTPEQIAASGPAGLVAHFPLDETDGDHVSDAVDAARQWDDSRQGRSCSG